MSAAITDARPEVTAYIGNFTFHPRPVHKYRRCWKDSLLRHARDEEHARRFICESSKMQVSWYVSMDIHIVRVQHLHVEQQHLLFRHVLGKYPPILSKVLASDVSGLQKACLDLGCGSGGWFVSASSCLFHHRESDST
jgi:hypothetical protein